MQDKTEWSFAPLLYDCNVHNGTCYGYCPSLGRHYCPTKKSGLSAFSTNFASRQNRWFRDIFNQPACQNSSKTSAHAFPYAMWYAMWCAMRTKIFYNTSVQLLIIISAKRHTFQARKNISYRIFNKVWIHCLKLHIKFRANFIKYF